MKLNSTLVLFCLGMLFAHAQKTIEKEFEPNNKKVVLHMPFASEIEVKTWDKDKVYFKADIWIKDAEYSNLYTVDIDESDAAITIASDTKALFKAFKKRWETKKSNTGYYMTNKQYDFDYVLYVPKNTRLKVKSINGSLYSDDLTGDVIAELINGDITLKNYGGHLQLSTINGAIDLAVADNQFEAATVNGEIYAAKTLKYKAYEQHVGQHIESIGHDSATTLKLNTVNGNMYLR